MKTTTTIAIISSVVAVVAVVAVIVMIIILAKEKSENNGNGNTGQTIPTNGTGTLSSTSEPRLGSLADHTGVDNVVPIAIFNQSTVVSDAEFNATVQAVQIQVSRDFFPVYKLDANLIVFDASDVASIPEDYWYIAILDSSDQAGALGYHSLTSSGKPFAKVFAKTSKDYGLEWSTTFSHEVLETLADPWAELSVFVQQTNTTGKIIAYEVCDACQDDRYSYKINGVSVSDFVYPAWFDFYSSSGPFDHTGGLSEPLEIGTGGYVLVFNVPNTNGWQDVTTDSALNSRTVNGRTKETMLCGRAAMIKNKVKELSHHSTVAKMKSEAWNKIATKPQVK